MAKQNPKENQNLIDLWSKLSRQYSDVPDFKAFKSTLQDTDRARQLHTKLTSQYDDVPQNFDVFREKLGLKKKITYEDFKAQTIGHSVAPPEYEMANERVERNRQQDQQPVKREVKQDVNKSLGGEEADIKTKLHSAIQSEYAKKYPGALTPPEKFNKLSDEVEDLQESYTSLIKNNPLKKDQYLKQYNKEVASIADSLGLYKTEEGDYTVNKTERELYSDIYKDNLKGIIEEQRRKEKDPWIKDALERLASSAERLYNVPSYIFALSERISNAVLTRDLTKLSFGGMEMDVAPEKDVSIKKEEDEYWQDIAKYRKAEVEKMREKSIRYNDEITELIGKGEVGEAVGKTALSIIEQVPQLLVFAGTGAAPSVGSKVGLGYVSTGVGAGEYVNLIDEDVSEGTRIMSMLSKAGSEFAFEAATTLPILKNLRAGIGRSGKDVIEREIQTGLNYMFEKNAARLMGGVTNGLKESAGEVATELTQQWSDAAAGQIQPSEIGKNLGDVAITSYLIGDGMTRVSSLVSNKSRAEAKKYLKEVYSYIPKEMSLEARQEALELMVKRDNLQSQMEKSSEGLQKGYQTQIQKIDQRLNEISEEELGQEATYKIGDRQFRDRDKFIEEVMQYEGQENVPEIEIENDQETSDKVATILEEGITSDNVKFQQTGGEAVYKINDTQYGTKESFLEAIEQRKDETPSMEISVENDASTAQKASKIIEKQKAPPSQQKFMELNQRLSDVSDGENVSDIGKEFAQIQDQIPQEDKEAFTQKLKDKQKKYVEKQEKLGREGVDAVMGMQTPQENTETVVESEEVTPENVAEQNKTTKDFREAQPMGEMQKNAFIDFEVNNNKLKHWHRKYLTARGYLPKEVFNNWVRAQGEVKVLMERVNDTRRQFNKALTDTYGKTKLGTPKVSSEQLEELNTVLTELGATESFTPPEGTQLKLELEKRPSRQEVLKKVPEKLREPLVEMRNQIDALSKEMIREGLVEGDLAAKITDNLGYYLTRTYRVHNDKKWTLENVPVEVKNRAINTIRKEFPNLTEDQLEGQLERLLIEQDMPLQTLNSGKKLGQKDLGILKKRVLEDKSIRDLLGEYKDPLYNYSTSVAKMADLITRQKFLEEVKRLGQEGDNPFLFTKDKAKKGFSTPIATEGSTTMSPLNGLYTTPELAEAFNEFGRSQPLSKAMRNYMVVNSALKYGKTILSFQTHARNYMSNYMFHVGNGRLPFALKEGPMQEAIKMFSKQNSAEFKEFYEEALRRGVVGESTWAGEVHDNIKESSKYMDEYFQRSQDNLWRKIKNKTLKGIEKAYRVEDEAHKLYAWKNEIDRYRKVYEKKHPDRTKEDIETMAMDRAADIVRNTMPTYSLARSKAMMLLRRSPVVGTFVSFPAEVIRNTVNTTNIAIQEMRDSDTRHIGARRMAGLLIAHGITTAVTKASFALLGLSKEDEEDIRKSLPPWSQNSDILMLQDKGKGVYRYIDVGYTEPYNFTKQILYAAMRGDSIEESTINALKEFSEPFIGQEILFGRLNDITNNRVGDTDQSVYNEALPLGDKMSEALKYLWQGVQPGGLTSFQRIFKSLKQYEGRYGKNYDTANEIVSLISGIRASDLNMRTSFYFNMKEIGDKFSNARQIYWDVKNRRGISVKKKEEAYRKANQAAKEIIMKANELYRGALRQQVPYNKVEDILDRTRVGSFGAGDDFKRMVRTGYYVPIDKY